MIDVKPLTAADEETACALWRRSRRAAYVGTGADVTMAHGWEEDFAFFTGPLRERTRRFVARIDDRITGVLAIEGRTFVDQLYVDTACWNRGIGSRLLNFARTQSPGLLELYTLQRNRRARSFYARHGFRVVRYGVSPIPESEPDVLLRWER